MNEEDEILAWTIDSPSGKSSVLLHEDHILTLFIQSTRSS